MIGIGIEGTCDCRCILQGRDMEDEGCRAEVIDIIAQGFPRNPYPELDDNGSCERRR